jgi:hypothetical protein
MTKKLLPVILICSIAVAATDIVLSVVRDAYAQETIAPERTRPETIQATVMGQLTAAGKTFQVTVNIESYSTPEDQKMLIDAFAGGGHNALVKTLSKMKSKGRVAMTGTLGYQIAYIRSIPSENGRTIRLITDRPIKFAEAYTSTRSRDYDLSGMEINIAPEQKQSDGSLVVAGKFRVDKNQQVTFESYGSGPWKLVNVIERN